MIGQGVVTGLGVTLRHFALSAVHFLRLPKPNGGSVHQTPIGSERGLFTVQYPEEKLALPERSRSLPMLLYDTTTGKDRCTSCGICAKVCPPQCIWIVRATGPDGRPVPQPQEFVIDASICMSCGFCAEYCPFDAIKMNHVYELSTPERYLSLLLHKADLSVPIDYHAKIHPTDYAAEEAERRAKEEADRQKAAARAAQPPRPPQQS